ncbi:MULTISPECIES: pantoate--beta-alanine ligase [unclassified Algoriphagus]|uniref:pantoate--beta-alanine ligase n=3 Tax=Algoriphagus TaxID=246875 RepID=UPI000C51712B|nr:MULTISPECIES: pantoate--beta-alanine ligase [unclassified Algoriphagus]MAL16004.1 pantoate--beta-alanine ligase [Algoriphagus sp.]QYH40622.1 pantoate--beta-alanine ligase [Algoriphagus sp. NBT04N3]HAD51781.1 pantoate--beta-alanine ligase [Algoriphagus sp.]HAS60855.1 pantoate--beta-alanine ligase [Algoriphagus sp.]HCH46007.1 pantoate--beta-alanine ligase [Algoriphagus sp.]
MQVFRTGADWNKIRLQFIQSNKSIGLVPTMGALHQGHLDLVKKCGAQADCTVVSIFVNPTQFNNQEDFEKYPSSVKEDLDLLESAGVDYVFLPEVDTMYPSSPVLKLNFGHLERILEGAFRPGHFNGVGVIVSKLFHIIRPDLAFFGQKDLQQVAIIQTLVRDLSFPIEIIVVPTRREEDGLAMSSRNRRLSDLERKTALIIFESLSVAAKELKEGREWLVVQEQIIRQFQEQESVKLEYFELVEREAFEIKKQFDPHQEMAICAAAYVGEIRLIDNLIINS